jgi:hypothetical protein
MPEKNNIITKLVGNTVVRAKTKSDEEKVSEEEQRIRDGKTKAGALAQVYDLSTHRNDHNFMLLPLFSTSKRIVKEDQEFRYTDGKGKEKHLIIKPTSDGIPTQRDADIIRYAVSKLVEVMHSEGGTTDKVAFTRYELLKAIGKDDSKRSYIWLEGALNRLKCTYDTNCFPSGLKDYGGPLILVESDETHIIIQFPDCIMKGISNLSTVLEISEDVIPETGLLTKRLREWLPARIGNKSEFSIGLQKLKEWLPYSSDTKYLKKELGRVELPYSVSFRGTGSRQIVTFTRK